MRKCSSADSRASTDTDSAAGLLQPDCHWNFESASLYKIGQKESRKQKGRGGERDGVTCRPHGDLLVVGDHHHEQTSSKVELDAARQRVVGRRDSIFSASARLVNFQRDEIP